MAQLHVRHVIGYGSLRGGCGEDLVGWHIEECRVGIDKAANQPGTGNTIDSGPFPRHPFHTYSPSVRRVRSVGSSPSATWCATSSASCPMWVAMASRAACSAALGGGTSSHGSTTIPGGTS